MIYDVIKEYGKGKGEDVMWRSVRAISDGLKDMLPTEDYERMERIVYASINGSHYNEEYAKEDVKKMYYTMNGQKVSGPYWTTEQAMQVYNKYKGEIPNAYNMWDFYVALNMTKADNCLMYRRWWQGASDEQIEQKLIEATVNYLNDADNPYGTEKIWCYLNV